VSPLVLSHFTVRNASFRERVAAAARHGFDAIGLYLGQYVALREAGHSDAELRAVLAEHGQRIHEYEALRGWGQSGAAYEEYQRRIGIIEQMADAFGTPSHVQVVGPYDGSLAEGAAAFGRMCDRLAERGIRAAVEYLPSMTNIPDAASAWRLVETAGRDNGGLCVDSWHHARSGESLEALAAIPADRVFGVQFDDGPAAQIDPDYRVDCMTYRQVPGEGSFDLEGFVRTLDGMGVTAAYAVEVISSELDRLPADEVARRVAAGSRAVLARARGAASAH
jgi:sugar phosphate isomerase/epimerase